MSSPLRGFTTSTGGKLDEDLLFRYACIRIGAGNLRDLLAKELDHEKQNQSGPSDTMTKFLGRGIWKYQENSRDGSGIELSRDIDGYKVTVKYRYSTPYDPMVEGNEEEGSGAEDASDGMAPSTDFLATVECGDGSGMRFMCQTDSGQSTVDSAHRFAIGNIKAFKNVEERDSENSYDGPEFTDLDEHMQDKLDEWLEKLGISKEVCEFIDESAVHKETAEYVKWLETAAAVVGRAGS